MELSVREMTLDEVELRINYFHSASPEFLAQLGVDPARLPTPQAWRASYERDYARPQQERQNIQLLWLGDGEPVGFSSVDQIKLGSEAYMHLHVLDAGKRNAGIGTSCVEKSAALYFDLLKLDRLFCQPNAFNTAPNRALQKAGFRFVKTYETTPSSLNFRQPVTLWVLEHGGSMR